MESQTLSITWAVFLQEKNMKKTSLLGIASLFVGRKMKIVMVGAQFGYMGYKYLKNRKKKSNYRSK